VCAYEPWRGLPADSGKRDAQVAHQLRCGSSFAL